ncbi:MAG: response regulator [Desulfobacterales bacterium]|nr:response regulator [Desulfobacterales bacterium]
MAFKSMFSTVWIYGILCWVASPVFCYTTTIKFDHLTIDEGLSQNTVNGILQDNHGFMWFATQDGLNKYDGYSFIRYKTDSQNTNSLSENYIYSLVQDQFGIMWIGTRGKGLNRFDPERQQFIHYLHNEDNPNSPSDDFIKIIYIDNHNSIWLGTENKGLDCFIPDKNVFKHYAHDETNKNTLSNNSVTSIYQDSHGILWIGTDFGLNRMNDDQKTFHQYYHDPNRPNSLPDNSIKAIYQDPKGIFWVGTKKGLVQFDAEKEVIKSYQHDSNTKTSLSSNYVNVIYQDQRNRFWVGTDNGLNILNKANTFQVIQQTNLTDPEGLTNSNIGCIFEDRSGNIWFGTFTGGVNKFSEKKFQHVKKDTLDPNSLPENSVWAICEDRFGILWLGTENEGLSAFNRSQNQFVVYKHDANNPTSISSNKIQTILEDSRGYLWIGTEDGLNRFDQDKKEFIRYYSDKNNSNSLSDSDIMKIVEDHLGILWIATYNGGLNQFDVVQQQFQHYKHDSKNTNSLSHNRVRYIYEDHAHHLWVGTENGLNRFDRKSGNFKHYFHDSANEQSLSNNRVYSILEDRNHSFLWMTTKNGLNRFDSRTETFTFFSEKHGLSNNTVYSILQDQSGHFWLSTNKGLSRFNPKTNQFRNFTKEDGLQSNEFNMGAFFQNVNHEMFFGGINGLTVFDPAKVMDNPHPPPVVITSFKIFDKEVLSTTDLIHQKEIQLSYKDTFFSFEFSALDYVAPQKNEYAYRLVGFDTDWIYCDKRRYASYTNLDGGKYIFQVKASNNDGLWNEKGTDITIILPPPPWKTWWAYSLYVISIVSLFYVYLFIKKQQYLKELRIQKIVHDAEILKEKTRIQEEVERISRHDLKTPLNSIISLPQIVLQEHNLSAEQVELLKSIEKSGYIMLNMINLSLHMFKMENKTYRLEPIKINLLDIINKIISDLKSLAESKAIHLNTIVENNSADQTKSFGVMGEELLCYSMFANLIKNAVEASPKNEVVSIRFTKDETDKAIIDVHNQGVVPVAIRGQFFDKYTTSGKKGGTGLGTYSARLMAETLGGEIFMKTSETDGTTITVRLPSAEIQDIPLNLENNDSTDTYHMNPLPYLKVLIADDDEYNRLIFKTYLKHPNLMLELTDNGKSVVEKCSSEPFDIIFMDLEMPIMNGIDATCHIRDFEKKNIEKKSVIIVALSAHDDLQTRQLCTDTGFNDYLQKPVTRTHLRQCLVSFFMTEKQALTQSRNEVLQSVISEDKPYWVEVDSEFEDLIPGFLEKKRVEMGKLLGSLKAKDFEEVRKLGHKLKGSFNMYGFKRLANICAIIEENAKNEDYTCIQNNIDSLHTEFNQIQITYVHME